MFGIMNHLKVSVVKDAEDAIEKGFNYSKGDFKPVDIERVVVVLHGTQAKKPTVDFVLQDQQGNKFVVMLTGELVRTLARSIPFPDRLN